MADCGEFDYLCRLCATKMGILMGLPIFEAGEQLRNIDKKITACLPVQISMSDQLPKVICQECAFKVDEFFSFREKVLQTEVMFMEMLKSLTKQEVVSLENVDLGSRLTAEFGEIQNSDITRHNVQNGIHSLPMTDNISLSERQEDDSQEKIIQEEANIQVADFHLHGNAVQLVNEQMQEIHQVSSKLIRNTVFKLLLNRLSTNKTSEWNLYYFGQFFQKIHQVSSKLIRNTVLKLLLNRLSTNKTSEGNLYLDNFFKRIWSSNNSFKEILSIKNEKTASYARIIKVQLQLYLKLHTQYLQNTYLLVSNQEIEMHLEGKISVENLAVSDHLDPLDMNYVTSIGAEDHENKQIVQYCNDVKFESVTSKDLQDRLNGDSSQQRSFTSSRAASDLDDDSINVNDSSAHSLSLPSTSLVDSSEHGDGFMVQYTKSAKMALLESALSNPTIDETETNWYVCPFCNEAASEPNNLAVHYEQHFCCCAKCELFFTSIDMLNLHSQECLEQKTDIDEMKNFNGTSEVQQAPAEKKSGTRAKWTPKVCTECGKQFRTNYKLQEHMRQHTGEKPFQCVICQKPFRSKIGLAQHTATHTGQFDFSCSTCGKGFQCKSYLIVHQRVHSNVKPYSCTKCNQNFKTKQSLLDHENRHMGVKPYTCDVCGRAFITKGLCKSHQKVHSGMDNRQYPCAVCNKLFVSKSYLNTHLRIHTGEKPYLCEVCGKGFLTRVDLKIHSTMHTGEKSFKCDLCGMAFARRSALRCHRRSHTGERPYRCEICGKTFTQFSPMAIHKRLHTGERPYECDLCGKAFVSRSTLTSHKKQKHKDTEASTEPRPPKEEVAEQKEA